nr:MAG: putative RNA-dependent RNA polymerase [Totiviridae sp.]
MDPRGAGTPLSLTELISRAEGRKGEFASLGGSLFGVIKSHSRALAFLADTPFYMQLTKFELHVHSLMQLSPLLPAAVSLLIFDYPLQVVDFPSITHALLQAAFPLSDRSFRPIIPKVPKAADSASWPNPRSAGQFAGSLAHNQKYRWACFPRKGHPGAHSKPVVSLGGLIRSLITIIGVEAAGRWLALLEPGTPEDVCVGHILYSFALRPHLHSSCAAISAGIIRDPATAKGLSNALKALGLNGTPLGACLTEGNVLQGRLVGAVDWGHEVSRRTQADKVEPLLVKTPVDALRPHVKAILDAELPGGFTLPDLQDFWTSRWAWCVNGSHTAESSSHLGIPPDAFSYSRLYRRMASEYLNEEPISGWDGYTTVSASDKLEHGKTRAIFACDTRSYFAWSWPLNAVQKAWKNKRVLLDPGRGGMTGIAHRIGQVSRRSGVNLMLDFDDFNSHHSTQTMQMVVEELMSRTDAPAWLTPVLVASLDSEYIKYEGEYLHVKGTLMSGHRGTTFFNSVLNAAYIRHAAGPDLYDRIYSLHTGDDVYARLPTLRDVDVLLKGASAMGCRLNPTKQSIGFKHAEFLRCAFAPNGAYGYVARSIATCASGSWTNTAPLGPREGLTNAMSVCRSIINRSGQDAFPRLIGPALRCARGFSVRDRIDALIGGRASIDNSPVFNVPVPFPTYTLKIEGERDANPNWRELPRQATSAYLSHHCSEIEAEALTMAGVDPQPLMVASSYSKGQAERETDPRPCSIERIGSYRPRRPGLATTAHLAARTYGALNRYPLIHLVAKQLTRAQLTHLLYLAGAPQSGDVWFDAFGGESSPIAIHGTLPYADASSIARATGLDMIYVSYPINM